MSSCESRQRGERGGRTNLSILELDVVLVVHERLQPHVVLIPVLLLRLGLHQVHRRLVRQIALDRNVSRVENNVLALLDRHILGDDNDGLLGSSDTTRGRGR